MSGYPLSRVHDILRRMEDNSSQSEAMKTCFGILAIMSREEANKLTIARDGMDAILNAMTAHVDKIDVQEAGCDLLWSLAFNNAVSKDIIGKHGGAGVLVRALKRHSRSPEFLKSACGALSNLCQTKTNQQGVASQGGLQPLVGAIHIHQANAKLLPFLFDALASLIVGNEENARAVSSQGGVPLIIAALSRHKGAVDVVKSGCHSLAILSDVKGQASKIAFAGGVPTILPLLDMHPSYADLHRVAAVVLLRMLQESSHVAREITCHDGVRILLKSLEKGGSQQDTVAAVTHILFTVTNPSSPSSSSIESQLWLPNPYETAIENPPPASMESTPKLNSSNTGTIRSRSRYSRTEAREAMLLDGSGSNLINGNASIGTGGTNGGALQLMHRQKSSSDIVKPVTPTASSQTALGGLIHALEVYKDRRDVVRAGCRLLSNIITFSGVAMALDKLNVADRTCECISLHPEARDVLESTATILKTIHKKILPSYLGLSAASMKGLLLLFKFKLHDDDMVIACAEILAKHVVLTPLKIDRRMEIEEYQTEDGRSWENEAITLSFKSLQRLTNIPDATTSASSNQDIASIQTNTSMGGDVTSIKSSNSSLSKRTTSPWNKNSPVLLNSVLSFVEAVSVSRRLSQDPLMFNDVYSSLQQVSDLIPPKHSELCRRIEKLLPLLNPAEYKDFARIRKSDGNSLLHGGSRNSSPSPSAAALTVSNSKYAIPPRSPSIYRGLLLDQDIGTSSADHTSMITTTTTTTTTNGENKREKGRTEEEEQHSTTTLTSFHTNTSNNINRINNVSSENSISEGNRGGGGAGGGMNGGGGSGRGGGGIGGNSRGLNMKSILSSTQSTTTTRSISVSGVRNNGSNGGDSNGSHSNGSNVRDSPDSSLGRKSTKKFTPENRFYARVEELSSNTQQQHGHTIGTSTTTIRRLFPMHPMKDSKSQSTGQDTPRLVETWPAYSEKLLIPLSGSLINSLYFSDGQGDIPDRMQLTYEGTSAAGKCLQSRCPTPVPYTLLAEVPLGEPFEHSLTFDSEFDSGNLLRAVQRGDATYDLFLRADLHTTGHTQWFYFAVANTHPAPLVRLYEQGVQVPPVKVRFNIVNLTKPDSLFNLGMRPVIYSCQDAATKGIGWIRAGSDINYYSNTFSRNNTAGEGVASYYTLSFSIEFTNPKDTYLIAYTYPYTYDDYKYHLNSILEKPGSQDVIRHAKLCVTLGGNDCDLLIITNFKDKGNIGPLGITTTDRKDLYKNMKTEPEKQSKSMGCKQLRKCLVISARVHPGETPASWMMKGLLDFLVSSSPAAQLLRQVYIIYVIPMLNPDGVIYGNNRCCLAGVDLNRQWKKPIRSMHPNVFYLKNFMKAQRGMRDICMYIDLHGHSRKYNVFMYGCDDKKKPKPQVRAFPKFLSMHPIGRKYVSYNDCSFHVKKGRESTARVVVARELNIPLSYTLEATFCGSNYGPLKHCHMNIGHLQEVGAAMCDSILNFSLSEGLVKDVLAVPGVTSQYSILATASNISNMYDDQTLSRDIPGEGRLSKKTSSSDMETEEEIGNEEDMSILPTLPYRSTGGVSGLSNIAGDESECGSDDFGSDNDAAAEDTEINNDDDIEPDEEEVVDGDGEGGDSVLVPVPVSPTVSSLPLASLLIKSTADDDDGAQWDVNSSVDRVRRKSSVDAVAIKHTVAALAAASPKSSPTPASHLFDTLMITSSTSSSSSSSSSANSTSNHSYVGTSAMPTSSKLTTASSTVVTNSTTSTTGSNGNINTASSLTTQPQHGGGGGGGVATHTIKGSLSARTAIRDDMFDYSATSNTILQKGNGGGGGGGGSDSLNGISLSSGISFGKRAPSSMGSLSGTMDDNLYRPSHHHHHIALTLGSSIASSGITSAAALNKSNFKSNRNTVAVGSSGGISTGTTSRRKEDMTGGGPPPSSSSSSSLSLSLSQGLGGIFGSGNHPTPPPQHTLSIGGGNGNTATTTTTNNNNTSSSSSRSVENYDPSNQVVVGSNITLGVGLPKVNRN